MTEHGRRSHPSESGPPYEMSFDPDEETAVEAVVTVAASLENRPPSELPPIARAIDPDALNELASRSAALESISFRYAGYDVTVRPGSVSLTPWE